MEDVDRVNPNEEDKIEWVHGGSLPPTPKSPYAFRSAFRVHVKQIQFNGPRSISHFEQSMALFLHEKTQEISICLNDMKDEIIFGIGVVEEFRISPDSTSIVFRIRSDFVKSYFSHPEGYPYRNSPIVRETDPTGGKLKDLYCINIKPVRSDYSFLSEVERLVQKMIYMAENPDKKVGKIRSNNDFLYPRSFGGRNKPPSTINRIQNGHPKSSADLNGQSQDTEILPVRYNSVIKKRDIYIVCIHPTHKRAVIYSSEGVFNHFQFFIKKRFGWKWERMWYKNKSGVWTILDGEETWIYLKKQVIDKSIPRIDVFMK